MPIKVAAFIDGENLVFRYQDMIKAGRRPFPTQAQGRPVGAFGS